MTGSQRAAPPRRTVRIVKRRIPSRAAGLSLAAVAATAVFSFAAWRWWSGEAPALTPPSLADVELEWRCGTGHTFPEAGQPQPRPCATCGAKAFPVAAFTCPMHGTYDVLVEFEVNAQGVPQPAKFRVQGGEWITGIRAPPCPKCGAEMERKKADPLAGMVRGKRKTGG